MKQHELTPAEIVAMAERMTDIQRRDLIGRLASIGDDQCLRIASWLIGLSLAADARTRNTLH
jgi:hypothetical protein